MSISFENDVVLVSGAAQGLGAAMADSFSAAGATVIAVDVNAPALHSTADRIANEGGRCFPYALDIRDPVQCKEVVALIGREHGPISVLVNNAGVSTNANLEDPELNAELDRVMGVNLRGALNLTLACLGDLKQTRGAVINVASTAGLVATFASVPYAASKAALGQVTRNLARELAPHGIRVNAVAPALVITPMTAGFDKGPESPFQNALTRTMLRRVGTPEDVAGPVLFLASGLARYVTGVLLPVDGGYTAN